MRWIGREQSQNIEDRRGIKGSRVAKGGILGTIIIAILVWLLGGNPLEVFNGMQSQSTEYTTETTGTKSKDGLDQFVAVVLKDTEDVWNKLFQQSGKSYREPTLVLYSQATESACGYNSSATGPFYCPGDEKVYIDLDFLKLLQQKIDAPGDFAQAYIIAHEVGHHVQKILGITAQLEKIREQVSEEEFNKYSVKLELQADFLAGIWAHYAQKMKNILEEGDIEEALNAASAVGDDRLMMKSRGYVVPDAFTHGTSKQRVYWFTKGFKTGDINEGDTFSIKEL